MDLGSERPGIWKETVWWNQVIGNGDLGTWKLTKYSGIEEMMGYEVVVSKLVFAQHKLYLSGLKNNEIPYL